MQVQVQIGAVCSVSRLVSNPEVLYLSEVDVHGLARGRAVPRVRVEGVHEVWVVHPVLLGGGGGGGGKG